MERRVFLTGDVPFNREPFERRVRRFDIEAEDGGTWSVIDQDPNWIYHLRMENKSRGGVFK